MIEYFIALIVGVFVGLIGSGGAIIAIPAFVYFANYSTTRATDAALVLVAFSSAIAVLGYARKKCILFKDTAYFAVSGFVGSYFGTIAHNKLNDRSLMIIFSVVLFAAALSIPISETLKKRKGQTNKQVISNVLLVLIVGIFFGFITALIGVGGGFIIIPLLTIVLHYQFKFAVGTSVVIILLNVTSAIIFRIVSTNIDLFALFPLAIVAGAGTFLGMYLNGRLDPRITQRIFAVFVFSIALFTLVDNLFLT